VGTHSRDGMCDSSGSLDHCVNPLARIDLQSRKPEDPEVSSFLRIRMSSQQAWEGYRDQITALSSRLGMRLVVIRPDCLSFCAN
jgi:hypothetical protein